MFYHLFMEITGPIPTKRGDQARLGAARLGFAGKDDDPAGHGKVYSS